ncbi:MAG: sensor histidine kinase [Desulfocucumaceae bacterium]
MASLAGALNAIVTVIDTGAVVVSQSERRGMGNGMGNGMGKWGMGGRMHGQSIPFDSTEVVDALSGETVVRKGISQSFGVDVILVALPLKSDGKVAGALLIHSPLAPIQANLRSFNEAVLYSLILGIAAATLLAFIFSRKVTGPILKMNFVARSMAEGNFGVKIPFKSGDELGVLAESINTLSGKLKEKIATIEEIDATRRSFVTSISHELRTPLTIMQGYTEALLDGIAQDEGQREKYLINIYEEALRLGRLVDDLLDLRRLETGNLSLRLEKADVSEIITSVSGQLQKTLAYKNITVELKFPVGLIARVDPDRVRQVIINLLDNAVRFSPGGGKIKIYGQREGDRLKVSITDEGPGINDGEKGLIWDKFYKTDNSRSERAYSGSGLGLAITKQIIDLHGGEIGVENKPGGGSTFWFII